MGLEELSLEDYSSDEESSDWFTGLQVNDRLSKLWRIKGMNNNRNGSSRSSYFRQQKNCRNLQKAAVGTSRISNFFSNTATEDIHVVEDTLEDSILSLSKTVDIYIPEELIHIQDGNYYRLWQF